MSNLQDGSGYGIYGQRYNSSGVAAGTEFRINTTTAELPIVTCDYRFSRWWFCRDVDVNGQDGSDYGVYGQRYNSLGVAAGTEFRINTTHTSTEYAATPQPLSGVWF
jgi:hypothetical protein